MASLAAQQGNVERTESVSEERAECQRWPTLDAESLPSNYLFIAYGLTSLPIAFLLIFVGRLVSYTFWVRTASTVVDRLDVDVDWFGSAPYFIAYYLSSQLLLISFIYISRVDWHALFAEARVKLLEKPT